jgi:hypothetical protein
MSDKLNFLEGDSPVGQEAASHNPAPAEPAGASPERDEQGRSVPPSVSEPSSGAAQEVAAPAPQPEPGQIPIAALLEERDKRKEAAARAEALERQLQKMRAAQAPRRALEPNEQLEIALYAQNLRASRKFAEREYGKDTIATVHDWAAKRCDTDPVFNQQMRSAEDPYEAAHAAYHREQILRTVRPGDLAAFKAWQAAQAAAGPSPAQAHHAPASVPRSLATASGNGAAGAPHVPIGPGQAFNSVIR